MSVAGRPAHVVDRPRRMLDEFAEAGHCHLRRIGPRSGPQVVVVEHTVMKRSASLHRIGVGPAEPMHAATPRRPGQIDSASEQTAMTIALRVPLRSRRLSAERYGRPRSARRRRGSFASARSRTLRSTCRVPALDELHLGNRTRTAVAGHPRRETRCRQDRPRRYRGYESGRPHRARCDRQPGRRSPSSAIRRAYVTPAPTRS